MRRARINHLWEGVTSFSRLIRCFYRAASAKFDREYVLRNYADLETQTLKTREDLLQERYEWGIYRRFWVLDPKLRQIESAPFRDRVVHHAIQEALEPIFDAGFYDHSYACRPGRGTHRAVKQLREWIGNHPDYHYLQMDVSRFFPSIDRRTLFGLIERKVADARLLRLLESLIMTAPGGEVGIPIGNLTSQLFANIYLDPLDQFIKRKLRVPLYVRYMDDLVLLSPNRVSLDTLRKEVTQFTQTCLKLHFHPHKVAFGRAREGITFVGYRAYPWKISVKGKSLRRFRTRMREPLPLENKVRRFLSYQGHLLHATDGKSLVEEFRRIAFGNGIDFADERKPMET